MEGIQLLLSAICLNGTLCSNPHPKPLINFEEFLPRNLAESKKALDAEMEKLAMEIKGLTLTVATVEDYPLSYVQRANDTFVGKGWAFEFFEYLMNKYNFSINIVVPQYNIIGSSNDSEGSLMQMITRNTADVGLAFVPMMADILKYVEFSTPLDEGEWKMIMTRPQESASGAGLLAPFDEIVWYFILVSLIITGPAIWCIIWMYHRFGKHTGEPYYNISQCIWYVYGGLMKQGSILSPNADSIRVAFATWWIFITILTSFYTANLTAFLTLARFSLPINVPKDIIEKRQPFISQRGFAVEYAIKNLSPFELVNVRAVNMFVILIPPHYSPLTQVYVKTFQFVYFISALMTDEELELLKPMLDKKLAFFTNENNDTDVLLNHVLKKNLVFIRDKPAIDHLVYEDYRKRKSLPSERLQCPFAMSKEISLRRKRGFIYPKGSKWKKLFDPQLRFMVEAGIINHRLNYGLPKAEICPQNLGSIERQLRLNDLMTTYLTMLVGFSTAMVVFLIEMMFRWVNLRKANDSTFSREQGTRRIQVQPSRKNPKAAFTRQSTKTISPPPAYGDAIKTIFNTQNGITATAGKAGSIESYRTLNGRTYAVVKDDGGTQLVPTRAPSAALFNYQMAYNSYK